MLVVSYIPVIQTIKIAGVPTNYLETERVLNEVECGYDLDAKYGDHFDNRSDCNKVVDNFNLDQLVKLIMERGQVENIVSGDPVSFPDSIESTELHWGLYEAYLIDLPDNKYAITISDDTGFDYVIQGEGRTILKESEDIVNFIKLLG